MNAGASGGNHGLLHSGARYIFSDPEAAVECKSELEILDQISNETFYIKADTYVNASGAWASNIAAMASIHINMVFSKGSLLSPANQL